MKDEETETEARHVECASGRAMLSLPHLFNVPWLLLSDSKRHRTRNSLNCLMDQAGHRVAMALLEGWKLPPDQHITRSSDIT